jgi:hypothetical protein
MSDVEQRLRAMLRERAQDVTEVPASIRAFRPGDGVRPSTPRVRPAWLVAAAVLLVAAVAAAVTTVGGSPSRPRPVPPATHGTTHGSTPAPTAAPGHAARKARLAWFRVDPVHGFGLHEQISKPGLRTVGLRSTADHGVPVNCNGCAMVSDWIDVFDAGAFSPHRYGVTGWTRTTVGGHRAYVGQMPVVGSGRATPVPTLAWQYRAGAWALVQGVTSLGGRAATLRALARATHPDVDVPIELPFRLGFVPLDRPITEIDDDRPAGYAFTMQFGSVDDDPAFDITLWSTRSLAGRFDTAQAERTTVGGLAGWLDPNQGLAVPYRNGLAVFGLSSELAGGDVHSPADSRRALERLSEVRVLQEQLRRSITWTNGDGSAPDLPAEQAIP